MISKFYPQAKVIRDFEATGLSVLAQNVLNNEILFLKVSEEKKLEEILKKYLRDDFNGLVVALTECTSIKKYNYVVLSDGEEFDKSLKKMTDHFYRDISCPVLAVTGTNGKTTTCWLLQQILVKNKVNTLYVGTIGAFYNNQKLDISLTTTTPSFLELRKVAHSITERIEAIVLEASSHALVQNRLDGLSFDVMAWTNFSQDHLDYHKTMDDYFEAKEQIGVFAKKEAPLFISPNQKELFEKVSISNKKLTKSFDEIKCKKTKKLFFKALYNQENLELAYAMASAFLDESIEVSLDELSAPPGRFEEVQKDHITFIIDYAHTPDALENVLREIRDLNNDVKIITIVGCGGNRDKSKRPQMAKVSLIHSDTSIFTSDNPRDEKPEEIISDMVHGINEDFQIIVDRKEAIEKSYELAKKIDQKTVVLIAGKGHETYQEIAGVRHFFSDRIIVEQL